MRTSSWSQNIYSIFYVISPDNSKWLFEADIWLPRASPASIECDPSDTSPQWRCGHSRPGQSIPWVDFREVWS